MDYLEEEQKRGITIQSAATSAEWNATTRSTSSTRRATSTSRPRSSARCACSTARSRSSTRSAASRRSRRRCGARRTATGSRACASSTRWTASARTSTSSVQSIADRLGRAPGAGADAGRPGEGLPRRDRPGAHALLRVPRGRSEGKTFDDREIPAGAASSEAQRAPPRDARDRGRVRRGAARPVRRGRARCPRSWCCGRCGPGTLSTGDHAGAVRLGAQAQGRALHARRASCDFLPSPLDVPPVEGDVPRTDEKATRRVDDDEPMCLMAFKTIAEPTGDLTFVRVYSGVLRAGTRVLNPRTGKNERIGRIVRMHANKREALDERPRGRHRRRDRAQEHRHRRHAVRRVTSRSSSPRSSSPRRVIAMSIEPKKVGRPRQARRGHRHA